MWECELDHPPQGRVHWRNLVNTIMNLQFPKTCVGYCIWTACIIPLHVEVLWLLEEQSFLNVRLVTERTKNHSNQVMLQYEKLDWAVWVAPHPSSRWQRQGIKADYVPKWDTGICMSSQGKSLSFKSPRIRSSGWKVDNRETACPPDRLLFPNSWRRSCSPKCIRL